MIDNVLFVVTFAAALGAGLIAGAFFAFSTFVMGALARLPVAQGLAAMQSINIVVINPRFLGAFVGTAVLCAILAVSPLLVRSRPGVAYLVLGSALYFVGTFLVTMVCNVPLNDALAKMDPASSDAARFWADYLTRWTMWNHVRTVAALAATASLTMAMLHSWRAPL
jgi:uncharacterized membrane protein